MRDSMFDCRDLTNTSCISIAENACLVEKYVARRERSTHHEKLEEVDQQSHRKSCPLHNQFPAKQSERPAPRHRPKLSHHARPPLPKPFRMVLLAVHFAQACEVHFGFDDGVCWIVSSCFDV